MPCAAAEATHTIVTREPEWDDSSRARAMKLDAYERSIDKETGLPVSEAYSDRPFIVHSDIVNYAARAIDRTKREDEAEHGDDPRWFDHRNYYAEVYEPPDEA